MQQANYRVNSQNVRPVMTTIWGNLKTWLSGYPDLEIIIRPYKSKRSIEQNKRLWALYRTVAEQGWTYDGKQYDAKVWHEYFKGLFIGYNIVMLPDGTEQKTPISTTTLNTAEMAEYQARIEAYAASELGIVWI